MIYLVNSGYVCEELLNLFLDKDDIKSHERMKLYLDLIPENAIWNDSYGPSSCLASIGLSWWRDVIPHLNQNLCLHENTCNDLLEQICQGMIPDTEKFKDSLGENTEGQFCLDNYPEAKIMRDKDNPYRGNPR